MLRIDAQGEGAESNDIGTGPFAVAVGFGAVWLSDIGAGGRAGVEPDAGRVIRIDPATGRLEDVIPVGKEPSGVATGAESVWVANGSEKTISRIDPRTNTVVDTIATRYYPVSLTYGHGFLWVSLHPEPGPF